ncbi:unnamed protein product [Caenorhabditis angaria]|uniref:Uncharacterized protein n=1 Tax=Caenorhabditis angaria TaxID=860376 RepID=A0A9P1MVM3_9PELO|nr:unnamed protein product [Caenorhabditis angaria]
MAFGGLLDGFLNEKSHGGGGVERKTSAFQQPVRKNTAFSMYQAQDYNTSNNMSGTRKFSSMSMMQQKKMSTVSTVTVDVYPKYSWNSGMGSS